MAVPNNLKEQALVDLTSGETLVAGLLDSSANYSFDEDTDGLVSDLPVGAEPSDPSYSRQTVSGVSVTQDDTNDEGVLDADNVVFPSLTTTNQIEVVFVARQSDGLLLAVFDDDSGNSGGISDLPIPTNGSDLEIEFDAQGILTIQ
jgi:dipeptidyl aminopeptidase/acylaminoacyl peptidase